MGLLDYSLRLLKGEAPSPWQTRIMQFGTQFPDVFRLCAGEGNMPDSAIGPYDILVNARDVQRDLLYQLVRSNELRRLYEEYKRLSQKRDELQERIKGITEEEIKAGRCWGCVSNDSEP